MDQVRIRQQKDGISLYIPTEGSFHEVRAEVEEKFRESAAFFGDAVLTLTFEGRSLSHAEENTIAATIEAVTKLRILCIYDLSEDGMEHNVRARHIAEEDILMEAAKRRGWRYNPATGMPEMNDAVKETSSEEQPAASMSSIPSLPSGITPFMSFPGNLKSGESYKTKENILVLGSIEDGAALWTEKNVIVIGGIYGAVRAGEFSEHGHFVLAGTLSPRRLVIDGIKWEGSNPKASLFSSLRKSKTPSARLAYAEDTGVVVTDATEENLSLIVSASDFSSKDPEKYLKNTNL